MVVISERAVQRRPSLEGGVGQRQGVIDWLEVFAVVAMVVFAVFLIARSVQPTPLANVSLVPQATNFVAPVSCDRGLQTLSTPADKWQLLRACSSTI